MGQIEEYLAALNECGDERSLNLLVRQAGEDRRIRGVATRTGIKSSDSADPTANREPTRAVRNPGAGRLPAPNLFMEST